MRAAVSMLTLLSIPNDPYSSSSFMNPNNP